MATLNLSITVNDEQMLSDVKAVLDNYEGENYEEKLKNFLKKKMLLEVGQRRVNEYKKSFTYPEDIEI